MGALSSPSPSSPVSRRSSHFLLSCAHFSAIFQFTLSFWGGTPQGGLPKKSAEKKESQSNLLGVEVCFLGPSRNILVC